MTDDITFKTRVAKLNGKRKHKILRSYKNKDAWRWIKRHKLFSKEHLISEKLFGEIIREIHLALRDKLLRGGVISLPYSMGRIELIKKKVVIKFDKNRLITNLPIDWNTTLKFWENDKEAFKQRKVIRLETKWLYRIVYSKRYSNFKNKNFFFFFPNRELKKELSKKIKNNEIDTFILDYGRIH